LCVLDFLDEFWNSPRPSRFHIQLVRGFVHVNSFLLLSDLVLKPHHFFVRIATGSSSDDASVDLFRRLCFLGLSIEIAACARKSEKELQAQYSCPTKRNTARKA
jgi:hypothetical protein